MSVAWRMHWILWEAWWFWPLYRTTVCFGSVTAGWFSSGVVLAAGSLAGVPDLILCLGYLLMVVRAVMTCWISCSRWSALLSWWARRMRMLGTECSTAAYGGRICSENICWYAYIRSRLGELAWWRFWWRGLLGIKGMLAVVLLGLHGEFDARVMLVDMGEEVHGLSHVYCAARWKCWSHEVAGSARLAIWRMLSWGRSIWGHLFDLVSGEFCREVCRQCQGVFWRFQLAGFRWQGTLVN